MDRIERFLTIYSKSNTNNTYRSILKSYFKTFYSDDNLSSIVTKYFESKRNYEDDMIAFYKRIQKRELTKKQIDKGLKPEEAHTRAPQSIKILMSVIREFLLDNDIEIPTKFWIDMRRTKIGSRPLTVDRPPEKEELRQLVHHMPLNGKALFMMLSSSGLRINEALSLNISDVDFTKNPTYVRIACAFLMYRLCPGRPLIFYQLLLINLNELPIPNSV